MTTEITYGANGDLMPAEGHPVIDPSWARVGWVRVDSLTRQIDDAVWINIPREIPSTTGQCRRMGTPSGHEWRLVSAADASWPELGFDRDISLTSLRALGGNADNPRFLGYAGTLETEAVNQGYYLRDWRSFLGVIAHDFDASHGLHTFQATSTENRAVIEEYGQALVGRVQWYLDVWDGINPRFILPSGDHAGELHWKTTLPEVKRHVDTVCDVCNLATWPRGFIAHADVPQFRSNLDRGILTGVDRSAVKWVPGAELYRLYGPDDPVLTNEQIAAAWAGWRRYYPKALQYYDEVVGV